MLRAPALYNSNVVVVSVGGRQQDDGGKTMVLVRQ